MERRDEIKAKVEGFAVVGCNESTEGGSKDSYNHQMLVCLRY